MSERGRRGTGTGGGRRSRGAARRGTDRALAKPLPLTPAQRLEIDKLVDGLSVLISGLDTGRRGFAEEVLRVVFENDAGAMAASNRLTSPGLALLLDEAESKVRVSPRSLTALLRVVAYDHLVGGRYWKRLLPSVKERLLPLVDPEDSTSPESMELLKDGAEQAVKFDLDPGATTEWVHERLRVLGREVRRNAGIGTYRRQLQRGVDLFASEDGLKRLLHVTEKLERAQVEEIERELERMGSALVAAAKKLKGRGR